MEWCLWSGTLFFVDERLRKVYHKRGDGELRRILKRHPAPYEPTYGKVVFGQKPSNHHGGDRFSYVRRQFLCFVDPLFTSPTKSNMADTTTVAKSSSAADSQRASENLKMNRRLVFYFFVISSLKLRFQKQQSTSWSFILHSNEWRWLIVDLPLFGAAIAKSDGHGCCFDGFFSLLLQIFVLQKLSKIPDSFDFLGKTDRRGTDGCNKLSHITWDQVSISFGEIGNPGLTMGIMTGSSIGISQRRFVFCNATQDDRKPHIDTVQLLQISEERGSCSKMHCNYGDDNNTKDCIAVACCWTSLKPTKIWQHLHCLIEPTTAPATCYVIIGFLDRPRQYLINGVIDAFKFVYMYLQDYVKTLFNTKEWWLQLPCNGVTVTRCFNL